MKFPISILLSTFLLTSALAGDYPRYENAASQALAAEAALIEKGDTPEAAKRYAIGDNPENQLYWTGKKPLPAARVADLLQLSLIAGYTTKDEWITSEDGSIIAFIAEPGCGASNRVFTIFRLNDRKEYERVGEYNFVTRYLRFIPGKTQLTEQGLTVHYRSISGQLNISKCFRFDKPEKTCRMFSEIDSKEDLGE
jgi:hypothetical protein